MPTACVPYARYLASAVIFFGIGLSPVAAQPSDPLSRFIWQMFKEHEAKTICIVGSSDLDTIRAQVVDHLRAAGSGGAPSSQAVASAVWTLYPCPFSPFRDELARASQEEVRGIWLFPEVSQPMRYGWKVELPKQAVPTKCEAVGYYADGELRNAVFGGAPSCPFARAQDLNASRNRPKVATWKVISPGRISISRTDVSGHIEEWDVYVVKSPFQVYEFTFEKGDLVQYLRREKGNDFNAATQFRHLKRLPE